MKFILILYIFLISQVLLEPNHDLGKYQKLNTNSSVKFFDITDFAVNTDIYLIITGIFNFIFIEYAFEDNLPEYADDLDTKGFILKRE